MFVSQLVLKSFALLVFIVLPSASVVVAQQQEEDDENATLMTNYNALREKGHGFFLQDSSNLYEKPGSALAPFVALSWWCDLESSSEDADTTNYGYVGRVVQYFLGSSLEDAVAQGAEITRKKKQPLSVSAVMVPTLGIFEGQLHATYDD